MMGCVSFGSVSYPAPPILYFILGAEPALNNLSKFRGPPQWFDGYHWGVKEIRDNDPQWNAFYESISQYLKDEVLRKLIEKHIDFSYTYNNFSLVIHHTKIWPNSSFSLMLHDTLIGSPVSPIKSEIALSEILEQIEDRLTVFKQRTPSESEVKQPYIQIVETYEDNVGECGLIFHNPGAHNLVNCRAQLLNLVFETPNTRFSLERYPKVEGLVCDQNVARFGRGKIPLFKWGTDMANKNLEIVYQSGTQRIGYDIVSVPILVLLNVWADNAQATYAVCKLEDRLGWGYKLSILKTDSKQDKLELATFQKNP